MPLKEIDASQSEKEAQRAAQIKKETQAIADRESIGGIMDGAAAVAATGVLVAVASVGALSLGNASGRHASLKEPKHVVQAAVPTVGFTDNEVQKRAKAIVADNMKSH